MREREPCGGDIVCLCCRIWSWWSCSGNNADKLFLELFLLFSLAKHFVSLRRGLCFCCRWGHFSLLLISISANHFLPSPARYLAQTTKTTFLENKTSPSSRVILFSTLCTLHRSKTSWNFASQAAQQLKTWASFRLAANLMWPATGAVHCRKNGKVSNYAQGLSQCDQKKIAKCL